MRTTFNPITKEEDACWPIFILQTQTKEVGQNKESKFGCGIRKFTCPAYIYIFWYCALATPFIIPKDCMIGYRWNIPFIGIPKMDTPLDFNFGQT
jgi:hypothetical protein